MSDMDWYKKEFHSNGCLCGSTKERDVAFCSRCMSLLPTDLHEALEKIDSGYPTAYECAGKLLDEEGVL